MLLFYFYCCFKAKRGSEDLDIGLPFEPRSLYDSFKSLKSADEDFQVQNGVVFFLNHVYILIL